MLPAMIFFLTFQIYPLLKALEISFHDWAIMPNQESAFVGLENYIRAFEDPIFWTALRNTVLYTIVTVPGQMIIAMLIALALERIIIGRVAFRTLYYLPVITSWVVVSLLFKFLFNGQAGLVNYVLKDMLHLVPEYIPWLQNGNTALIVLMVLGIWKGIGWAMIIFLAGLQGIPYELHEAAAIDGANRWHRFWNVTMPMMRPTIVFVLVMLVIGGFNVFISVYLITGGGPMHQTEMILTYMYDQAFGFLEFGYGAALSFILAAIIFTLSFIQIKYLRDPVEV